GTVPSVGEFADRLMRWWDLGELAAGDGAAGECMTDVDVLDHLDVLLDDAVHLRMQADVPVAAMLSGGIDSTLVVSSMVRCASDQVKTFTVAFDEPSVDEAAHGAAVARALHTSHEEIRCPAGAALALVERLPEIYDDTFA